MAAFTDLYDDLLPDLPGAQQPLVLHHIKLATIEFCERSRILRREALMDVAGGAQERTLPVAIVPAGHKLVEIEEMLYLGKPIDPATSTTLRAKYSNWKAALGTPNYYAQERSDTFWLVPSPSDPQVGALQVAVSVAPLYAAATLDDMLLNDWRSALAAGVKHRLKSMQRKPWTDPEGATDARLTFDSEISNAGLRAMRGTARAPMSTKPYHF